MRRAGSLPRLVLATLVASVFPAAAAPPALRTVEVRIEPSTPPRVPLGREFEFDVVITNNLPSPVVGEATIDFVSPQPGERIELKPWAGGIPAFGSIRLPRTVNPGRWFDTVGTYAARASGVFRMLSARELGVIAVPNASLPVAIETPPVPIPRFQDVTLQVGIVTQLRPWAPCQDYVAGAAWGDVDADGDLDLFIPQRVGPSELWINQGGAFVERAAQYGVQNREPDGTYRVALGSIFIDYDADGLLDLFVIVDGRNRLYRNTGSGFADVAAAAGITDDANHTSAAWGDFDADGNLDLYVTSHGRRTDCTQAFGTFQDRLYRSNGAGGFMDASNLLPEPISLMGLGFQGSWFDYNNDGRLDLYVANDHIAPGNQRNVLWRNDGPGAGGRWTFTNVSVPSGAGIEVNAMGTGIGDFNRDGFLDVTVSHLGPVPLLLNRGDGTFRNVARQVGLNRAEGLEDIREATWAMVFEDLNADGWEDLYVAAGELETDGGPADPQENQVFVSDGASRFLDLSGGSNADDDGASRGVAFADYDGDGRVDMFVMNQEGTPRLYRNVTTDSGNWLHVRVAGRNGQDACGARVDVLGVTPAMTRQIFCGSTSLGSGSDPDARLGLGVMTQADLRISWPTGETTTLTGVAADQRIVVARP